MTNRSSSAAQTVQGLREAQGWSIEDLASRAGVSWRTVWDLERGHRTPRRATAYVLAHALGVRVEDILPLKTSGVTDGNR
jgi:transcriptional regulator with XRE-family HTH domain